jgi:hypothetical protein
VSIAHDILDPDVHVPHAHTKRSFTRVDRIKLKISDYLSILFSVIKIFDQQDRFGFTYVMFKETVYCLNSFAMIETCLTATIPLPKIL